MYETNVALVVTFHQEAQILETILCVILVQKGRMEGAGCVEHGGGEDLLWSRQPRQASLRKCCLS